MSKKKTPQLEPGPAQPVDPPAETVEKFDSLMAEEARKAPVAIRKVGPFDVGAMIRERLTLPAGASLEFKTWKLFFLLPPDTDLDHEVEAVITAGDKATARAALDAAIRAAQFEETWSYEEARFFLHAVQFSGPSSSPITLRYIFRLRPAEASAERR